ncbi:hypothetical protein F5984_03780 [Rudanella paleaurantiibacter]|uniref:Uncharacterized protein n=1 Tax=Rudanella paleaurantiibacter TaxID=2614655 RepID=A0A7J5U5F1_9BACT|nr:hypothetical protein [Rudanella paleaurantiibacter]KAB7733068.1 hypothetical protein F5984_03780 [Rudanella paleaurantiibacter]
MNPIEPGILPLVEALNATGLVQTFSSCEGHFDADGKGVSGRAFVDRGHAYVRFIPAPDMPTEHIERLLGNWLLTYKKKHGLMPVRVVGYKLFTPVDDEIDVTFVLELHPFNRFDPAPTQRADIDRAARQLANYVGNNA